MSVNALLKTISNMPELAGKVSPAQLAKMVMRTNLDGFYHTRGQAPVSVMIRGEALAPYLGIEQAPLYYTMTASGNVNTGSLNGIRLTTDLAKDMGFKNPPAEVCLDGGKSLLFLSKLGFFAVTCVYGDPELFERGDVIAKGGVRIMAEEGLEESAIHALIEPSISQYLRAFVDLGTLGFTRCEGPDMKPKCLNEGRLMELIDQVGRQAERDLGQELVPFTTSGPAGSGFFNHDAWRGTSYGLLECLAALLSNRPVISRFGIDLSKPVTMNVMGYGEVGSNNIRLLKEVERYSRYGIQITGISDESGAFYNPAGFDLDMLYTMAGERERGFGNDPSVSFTLTTSAHFDDIKAYQIDRDELIYMPAAITVPAGPPYVIQNPGDVSRLNTQIWAPVANAPLGTKTSSRQDVRDIETAMLNRGIISIPAWILNFGGISLSKEEIMHRLMAGGIDNLKDPYTQAWLREHVIEGDVSDTAWANMSWVLHVWERDGYKTPISDLMESRVGDIQNRRKAILMGWDRSNNLLGNFMRMDSATMRAKVEVTAQDYTDRKLSDMRALLTDWNAPEEERRVAADVLGKLCSRGCEREFLAIIERGVTSATDQAPQSSVMVRNAAVGLGYILEGKGASYGDISKRIAGVLNILRNDVTPDNFGKIIWLEWLLNKLND